MEFGTNRITTLVVTTSDGVNDTSIKAKAKDFRIRIVLEDPRGRGLVLEDSNTGRLITVG